MRKVFISYHHKREQAEKNKLAKLINDYGYYLNIKDMSVEENHINPTWKDLKIIKTIRQNHLKETNITILILGTHTKCRKHIDWEIDASLNQYGSLGRRKQMNSLIILLTSDFIKNNKSTSYNEDTNDYHSLISIKNAGKRIYEIAQQKYPIISSFDEIFSDIRKLKYLLDISQLQIKEREKISFQTVIKLTKLVKFPSKQNNEYNSYHEIFSDERKLKHLLDKIELQLTNLARSCSEQDSNFADESEQSAIEEIQWLKKFLFNEICSNIKKIKDLFDKNQITSTYLTISFLKQDSNFADESEQSAIEEIQWLKKFLLNEIFLDVKKLKGFYDESQFNVNDFVALLLTEDTENKQNSSNFGVESQQTTISKTPCAKKTLFNESEIKLTNFVTSLLTENTKDNQNISNFTNESEQATISKKQCAKKTFLNTIWTTHKPINLKNWYFYKNNNSEECPAKQDTDKTQFKSKKPTIHDFKISKKVNYSQECPEIFSKLFSVSKFNKHRTEINNSISVNCKKNVNSILSTL